MALAPDRLVDTFGRVHNNLRISVTDRCNIRCFYCMPEDNPVFVQRCEILTFEEIERFVRVAVRLGINKIRLTGGEPLVRRDLPVLVRKLAAIPEITDLALTTNGLLLPELARPLYDAGLRRINVHLDTLNPAKFEQIVRRPGFERVLEGIFACKRLGYGPIKLNAVAVRGLIEDDLVPLAQFGREHGIEVRFIEFMPLDADGKWQRDKVLFATDILDRLSQEIAPLVPAPDQDSRAPASEFVPPLRRTAFTSTSFNAKRQLRILPSAVSRIRLQLMQNGRLIEAIMPIRPTPSLTDDDLVEIIRRNVHEKWEGHEINTARFVQPPRPMYAIGG